MKRFAQLVIGTPATYYVLHLLGAKKMGEVWTVLLAVVICGIVVGLVELAWKWIVVAPATLDKDLRDEESVDRLKFQLANCAEQHRVMTQRWQDAIRTDPNQQTEIAMQLRVAKEHERDDRRRRWLLIDQEAQASYRDKFPPTGAAPETFMVDYFKRHGEDYTPEAMAWYRAPNFPNAP